MTTEVKFWDGVIVCVTVCLLGAQSVLGDHISHMTGQFLFYGGLIAVPLFVIWKLWWRRSEGAQTVPPTNHAGRDNSGIQQVIHGGVHYHAPTNPPAPLETESDARTSARNTETRADLGFTLARATTNGQINRDGLRIIREPLPSTFQISPDWPIRELFFHIKPDILETPSQDEFDGVCEAIHDKLSIGQLSAWGRAYDGTRSLPLAQIPADYWQSAKLHPWLLQSAEEGGNVLQARPISHRARIQTQYREILLNHAQAVAIWPIKREIVQRDAWLQDGVLYAIHGRWFAADERAFPGDDDMGRAAFIADEMREKAGGGIFFIWGKESPSHLHVLIPKEFWIDQQIGLLRLIGDAAKNVETESATLKIPSVKYQALMVSKVQVQTFWPLSLGTTLDQPKPGETK